MSQSSPETGDARRDEADGKGADAKDADAEGADAKDADAKDADAKEAPAPAKVRAKDGGKGSLSIELEVSRNRFAGWTIFGLVFGALLIWKLGTVGQWVGGVLMVLGALRGWQLLQTFLHEPGTIVVGDDEVVLPRGLCMSRPLRVPPRDVTAVYFLRRSVPWNRSAPVLVVELGPKAMAFPRDWFASEADQRHIIHALLRVREGAPAGKPAAAARAEPAR